MKAHQPGQAISDSQLRDSTTENCSQSPHKDIGYNGVIKLSTTPHNTLERMDLALAAIREAAERMGVLTQCR